jgi:hypothetical protein
MEDYTYSIVLFLILNKQNRLALINKKVYVEEFGFGTNLLFHLEHPLQAVGI